MILNWALAFQRQKAQAAGTQLSYGLYEGTVQDNAQDGTLRVSLDGASGSVVVMRATTDEPVAKGMRVTVIATGSGDYRILGTVK